MKKGLLITILLLTAGCGQKAATELSSAAPSEDIHQKVLSQSSRDAVMERLHRGADEVANNSEQPDSSYPLSGYTPLNLDNSEAISLYAAYSPVAPDYEAILSAEGTLQGVTDVFQKQALIDKAKPQMDEKIAAFKKNRYYILQNIGVKLGHFDLQKQVIPVVDFGGSQIAMSAAHGKVRLVQYGSDKFATYKPDNLEKAKEIESLVSAGNDVFPTEWFVFVKGGVTQQATYGSPDIVTKLTRIRAFYPDGHPKHGQVLFEY